MRFQHHHHRRQPPEGFGLRLHHPGFPPGPGMPGPGPVPLVPPFPPVPPFGPWGRRGPGHRGGGRGRAGRGDVRAAVLLLLVDGPKHGYQLMQAIAERTGGAWQPSPGAVYPTISQLEDEGLVTVTAEGGRRLVTLTEAGQAHVAESRASLGDPFAGFAARAGGTADLLGPAQELNAAVWQVARTGTPDQASAAHKILTDARRALYLILAGDSTADAPKGDASPADGAPKDDAPPAAE
ncbi:PadR family transcriptional regulator [Frankia sp. CNm7]|uniref:PadR family transcriptional regulator n=1 Tax=Frankia nepalensis TaxID=1836974 RepID=A0A937URT5_9ACTN|nr:PadR family transcriptional regulator [Frankia nepalensis]MBL7501914.1 PadR family transcriptional regulator [Frankia nepalensis]MBL7513919.1 PadR family transcriptional regulator [Frankia nepalensis]MBL7518131.1 PadR family transcriptional regulator [Frankia nepalensis]MBL7629565.1 PadR family transcriptional regulator [Frankia nepalensis]